MPFKHTRYDQFQQFLQPFLASQGFPRTSYEVVCVFREPIDWLSSWWRYRSREELADPSHRNHRNYAGHVSFEQFARTYMKFHSGEPLVRDDEQFARLGRPSRFVQPHPGEPQVDRVFRYDRLDLLVEYLCKKVGREVEVDVTNVSPNRLSSMSEECKRELHEFFAPEYRIYERANQENTDLRPSGIEVREKVRREKRLEKIHAVQRRAKEGSLPDFIVIGTQKGGTSDFYRLLTEHPLVRRAATKELHFFNRHFAEGVGWYMRCFPERARVDGQRTVTGESTPLYLFDPRVPKRIAEVVPDAKLIALLRNPIDRAYSHYQMQVRRGTETRSFEEATEEERTSGEGPAYLARGLYAEQLERFSFFADRGQLLIIKSENLFAHRVETLGGALRFLGLPHFDPPVTRPAGKVAYEPMDPTTRRRLQEFFAPHNERLYDLVGTDFGW